MRRMSTVRRLIEKEYGLEDGELDGMRMKQIYEIVGEEDGALDRFRFVQDEDNPRDNNTCPYCGKDADFVDSDEDSTKYQCHHCGEDFIILFDGTYTTRNGFLIKEK